MKINSIQTNNYKPLFKGDVVAYPELNYTYSDLYATKSDALSTDPVSALLNKFAKAYRLLFNPAVDKEAKNIQEGIDTLFDNAEIGKNLNKIA